MSTTQLGTGQRWQGLNFLQKQEGERERAADLGCKKPSVIHIFALLLFSHNSCVQLFVTLWTAARQPSLSFTISKSLPKLMSIESVMPSNHLILCRPLLLLTSIFPSIRLFSNKAALGCFAHH